MTTLDCDPNHYCEPKTKVCAPAKTDGEECLEGEECLKGSRCKYKSMEDSKGVCKKMFSMVSGESFFARNEDDIFFC